MDRNHSTSRPMGTCSSAVLSRVAMSSSIYEPARRTKNRLPAEVALSLASRFKLPDEMVWIVGKTGFIA